MGSFCKMTWCDDCSPRALLTAFREGTEFKGVVGITWHVLVALREQITVQCYVWHHRHTPISEE